MPLVLVGGRCGDGQRQMPQEACDDGNQINEASCPYGTATCSGCNQTCTAVISNLTGHYCGDGTTQGANGESCDDGNSIDETACPYGTPTCIGCDHLCQPISGLAGPFCGDGVVSNGEVCDDANGSSCGLCAAGCDQAQTLAAASGLITTVDHSKLNDGETFTVSDGTLTKTFEFDLSPAGVDAGNVAVPYANNSSADAVALAIVNAVNGTAINLTPVEQTAPARVQLFKQHPDRPGQRAHHRHRGEPEFRGRRHDGRRRPRLRAGRGLHGQQRLQVRLDLQGKPEGVRAVILRRFGGPESVELGYWPEPSPKAGEVEIQVHCAGLNPVDAKIRGKKMWPLIQFSPPLVMGNECSGVVTRVGEGVKRFKVGDRVMARTDTHALGAFAERVCLNEGLVGHLPDGVGFREGGAFSLGALTAHQALFEVGKLERGSAVSFRPARAGSAHWRCSWRSAAARTWRRRPRARGSSWCGGWAPTRSSTTRRSAGRTC